MNKAVSLLARLVGLNEVMGTKIGNESLRGISGGEKKRVSLAEAMTTCPRCVYVYSRGEWVLISLLG